MSDKEEKIYGVASILIVGMCLFPPWEVITGGGMRLDKGYSLIAAPPQDVATINYVRLGVQILAVAAAAFGISEGKERYHARQIART